MNRTESLPMVALRGMTILPEMVAHFDISRERSIEAVQEAMASDQKIFLLTQKDVEVEILRSRKRVIRILQARSTGKR